MSITAASIASLAVKAAATASVVVAASVVAERSRPAIAGIVLSLPVSAGPAYVVLSLAHDAAFIAEALIASLAINMAGAPAVVMYAHLARRGHGVAVALSGMLAIWWGLGLAITSVPLAPLALFALNAAAYGAAAYVTWGWREAPRPAGIVRRWYDLPFRAVLVASVVVAIALVSGQVGPRVSGLLALFPASFSSFVLLMQPRLGGVAAAAAMTSTLALLIGFAGFLYALHLFAQADLLAIGFPVAIAIPLLWSALFLAIGARRTGEAQ